MHLTRATNIRWTAKFLTSKPGRLILLGNRLTLIAEVGVVFSIERPWPEMDWPWFGFGSTLRIKIEDKTYYINFIPKIATVAESAAGSIEAAQWSALLSGDPKMSGGVGLRWLSLALVWKGILALSILAFGVELLLQSGSWIGQGAGVVVILFAVIRSVMRLRSFRAESTYPEAA